MQSARSVVIALIAAIIVIAIGTILAFREPPVAEQFAAPQPSTPSSTPIAETLTKPDEFRAAQLRGSLPEICSEEANAIDSVRMGELTAMRSNVARRLSASTSAEHLLLAARFEGDTDARTALLSRALSGISTDPFLLWHAVQICSAFRQASACPLRELEQRLITADGQNSESWIRVAANRYAAGEQHEALQAIRHAATSAESRAFWPESIEMIERGLAAGGDFTFPERTSMAFSFAAAEQPRYGEFVDMCKTQSAKSVDWAYACIAYGELVEKQGKTIMGASIGRSIQMLAFEALGDMEKAADVQQRIEANSTEILNANGDIVWILTRVLFSEPALFSAYLARIRADGEKAAQAQMAIEVERLLGRPLERVCESSAIAGADLP